MQMAAESNPEASSSTSTPQPRRPMEDEEYSDRPQQQQEKEKEKEKVDGVALKIEIGAKKEGNNYMEYYGEIDDEEKPEKVEVIGWYMYGLCSYFILTVLIPILFPLIISQIFAPSSQEDVPLWSRNQRGFLCRTKELHLYEGLTNRSINVGNLKFSPLEWTSISWFIGLILAGPILGSISIHLDYGHNQKLISAAAITIGALFCLPEGFFKTPWTFPPYITFIVAAYTVASATHTQHLGLMVRGIIGSVIVPGKRSQFQCRREVAGWLSLFATAAGSLGSAIISAFTYHMLGHGEKFVSLWVVSIFSGLISLVGILHVFVTTRHSTTDMNFPGKSHILSIFKYPHAIGSLAGVFLSSFSSMCIFTGGLLFLVGQLCIKPVHFLLLLLTYFIFPLLSLPLSQLLQLLIKADAVKMQVLGFLLSTFTSGMGFYFRHNKWHILSVLILASLQSTSVGLLHAFGRVLLLDCSPIRKEGAFSVWFSWVRILGSCIGFTVASIVPGDIGKSFGIAFCITILGIVILIFGNISSFGGALHAGHAGEDSEMGSPAYGLDTGTEEKGSLMHLETLMKEEKMSDV